MSKKLILVLVLVFLFFGTNLARAEVIINEVQLSPTEGRFIELYNTGDSTVDFTDWYIQRKTATGSTFGSLVSKTNFEGKSINAHDYFLISKISLGNSDLVVDSLTLTESNTIQLKNSSGEVIDKLSWGSASDCSSSCPTNPTEGQSLQRKTDGSWVGGSPTPGEINTVNATSTPLASDTGSGDDNPPSSSSSGSSSGSTAETKIKTPVNQKIRTQITGKTLAYVNIPLALEGLAFGHQGEQLFTGRYFWNFGDGSSREINVINTDKFTHTYFYPGEYTILFEYYPDTFADTPEASSQITVKVVSAQVFISKVGGVGDFFIELTNNTEYNTDLSN